MGTTETTLEATAVTPSLFYGDTLNLPHLKAYSVDEAVEYIRSGNNALVDNDEVALLTLLSFGVSVQDAKSAISLAKFGLPRRH